MRMLLLVLVMISLGCTSDADKADALVTEIYASDPMYVKILDEGYETTFFAVGLESHMEVVNGIIKKYHGIPNATDEEAFSITDGAFAIQSVTLQANSVECHKKLLFFIKKDMPLSITNYAHISCVERAFDEMKKAP